MDDSGLRLPPQNLDAERSVLGGMALNEEALELGLSMLVSADFYNIAHTIMFDAMRSLRDRKMVCDPVTMCDWLVSRNKLEDVGGVQYVEKILCAVPHWAHTRHYANIVKRESVRRRLIYLALSCQDSAYDPAIELEPLITQVSNGLDDLVAERSDELHLVSGVVQDMREALKRPERIFKTGLGDLDKMLDGGIRTVYLTVFAARPSIGKTSLGWQIAEHVAKSGEQVVFFTLEMTGVQLITRVAKQGVRRADEVSELPIYIERYLDLDQIMNCIRMAKRRHGVRFVVIDYLQIIRVSGFGMKAFDKISHSVQQLKWLANELEIAIVVLAQINRKSEERDNKRPQLSDLKGSGSIEEVADVVVLLHRPEYYDEDDKPGVAELHVAKHRNGSTGRIETGYVKEKTMFVPFAERPIDVSSWDGTEDPKGRKAPF